MNSKKAKRIRQLVRHLQGKAAVDTGDWVVAGNMENQRMLDPACGRSIYKQMKKNAVASDKTS